MAQVPMLSDEWLSRYGLLENFNTRIAIFEGVLDFNLQPHPWPGPRGPMRTGTGTGTGTWTTGVTAIALCTSCSRAKNYTKEICAKLVTTKSDF